MIAADPVLTVDGLSVAFHGAGAPKEVLSAVSFTVRPAEILGIVGESGSGKSVSALAIIGLLGPQGRITAGSIRFKGRELVGLDAPALRDLRGREIAMIFQEPMTSLNPLFTVGFQIAEVLREKLRLGRDAARERAIALLERVGIPEPARRFGEYPHVLSGGMRQRVMIALAMACNPGLLLADEPTTALDVSVQAQILELMHGLRATQGTAILLITHDMGVIARMADRVVVMYAGEVMETASLRALFERPAHPYSRLLMAAMPTVRRKAAVLPAIPGLMPGPGRLPPGCRFHPRCPLAIGVCRAEHPRLREVEPERLARCHRAEDMLAGALA
jgi:oligopeptide/dipeptide ABC transporter ATP-binding protein